MIVNCKNRPLHETLVHELGAAVKDETTLFPDVQPAWIKDAAVPRSPPTGAPWP
jgi:hypothetical protein